MPLFLAKIRVTLKTGVNDPQGVTIGRALGRLGFGSVEGVRAGKYFEVRLNEASRTVAETKVREMCEKLLANPVIERFSFDLEPARD
jgi:phosphoribosylformylglycinamidine synthase subunit PurS